jgi:hypothetical protein
MTHSTSPASRSAARAAALLLLGLTGSLALAAPEPVPSTKPVLLYSRYYNAEGETRYLPDGTFQEVLTRLREHFTVRVHSDPLTARTLADVNLLLLANPSDQAVKGYRPPHHVSAADITTLTRFVERGGGLILMGNQENHNLEVTDVNSLLARFGLQFTNLYTDAKQLTLPKSTPLIGGLRWAYYTGNLVRLQPEHPAHPRALVTNDLSQKPVKGTRDQAGALLAVAEPGRGHVAVVTDSGWLTDDALSGKGIGGVSIQEQDNWEIFLRLARWTAGARSGQER